MKNVLLLGLLLFSATIYAEHHGQHGMENMHSHEGHLHNEMVNGKTLEVDAQRFDKFMVDIDNHVVAVVSVCLLYTSLSPRDRTRSRMPSSA